MKTYKIGEVARLLGSTTQTLRFYEQEGIIVPRKSENGTRYYSEADIIRLLAFRRYQLIDFSVQNVAEHFKHGNLDSLLTRMEDTSVRLKQESARLLLRAEAIDRFGQVLRMAQQSDGSMTCVTRPTLCLHACTLSELEQMDGSQRKAFNQFMNAMPDAHICFLYRSSAPDPLKFYFTISENRAETWQLPLENTLRIAGGPCVRLFVRGDARLWQPDYLNEQIARVVDAGYRTDSSLPVIVQHLSSEHAGKRGLLIAAIYVPIII